MLDLNALPILGTIAGRNASLYQCHELEEGLGNHFECLHMTTILYDPFSFNKQIGI